jgi:DNA sulfur modification protein DndC
LPRCWVATPIEHLLTDDVWDYLLEKPNIWGGNNHSLYQLYKNASGGECPLVVDKSTPSCGNSRFGCWTCTVVNRDKTSEGLVANGDLRMREFLKFREKLSEVREPQNGYRDAVRKNGEEGAGPINMAGRKLLLECLLSLQQSTKIDIVSEDELHWIQVFWKSARNPDNGTGVADLIFQNRGESMPVPYEDQLDETRQEVAKELEVSVETLVRLVEKIQEYSESHRKVNLDRDLKQILQDDLMGGNSSV